MLRIKKPFMSYVTNKLITNIHGIGDSIAKPL